MAKQNFTTTGVALKMEELYALPSASLQIEIANVRSGFSAWINENFNLSTAQQTYLSNMDANFLQAASVDLAIALENGLSVSLDTTGTVSASKLIRKQNTIELTWDPSNGVSATGDLTFEMVYL
ncbi:hypothetical protein [Pedobacter sp. UBA4863]|uniref:hypothetical protein n=1 Tax=Pedobacter sp. UBA4863 TaxID=1947060 RepID=UPI0025D0DEE2|nr:hypothetical protein [Pedobacter sp. UBA4863]